MTARIKKVWEYFEVAYRTPEGGSVQTGLEAPNRRHAIGMAMRGLPEGHALISATPAYQFTEDQRGYHGLA